MCHSIIIGFLVSERNGSDKGLKRLDFERGIDKSPGKFVRFLRVILENSFLGLGRRNEEETRAHFLNKRASSPTAAITLSIISCGISTDFTIRALGQLRWDGSS